jgi:putative ABC transport system permease protein
MWLVLDHVRYAIRTFARAKTTTAVLLFSLAVGTGANAALYRVTRALLFDAPAGVHDPSRLVSLFTAQFNGAAQGYSSFPDYLSIKTSGDVFESLAAFDDSHFETIALGSLRQRVRIVAASDEFFNTLRMTPVSGRLFGPEDAKSSKAPAVISHSLWRTLGEPSDAVGNDLRIGDRDYSIVGIAPPRFNGLELGRACDVWTLLDADGLHDRGNRRFSLIGRLAAGTSREIAKQRLERLSTALASQYPATNRGTRTSAEEPRQITLGPYTRMDPSEREQVVLVSIVVLGATGLVLLSACVNAATLLLSRSAARRRELAVKLALGASRQLLARQALVEGFVLAIAAAAAGLLLAHWTSGVLPAFFTPEEAEMLETHLGPRLVLLTFGLSLGAGALFALGPARHATETLDVDILRADAGGVSDRANAPIRAIVVTGQVALSTVMLIAAGLLVQALSVALQGDLGPGGRGVAVALLRMPGDAAGDVLRGVLYQRNVIDSVRTIPGVEAVGWVGTLPVGRSTTQRFRVDSRPGLMEVAEVEMNIASPTFFNTMRIPVIEGRPFTADDGALGKPVVVINDILARRYFGASAVGRQLVDEDGYVREVVGVVRSGKYRTFQEAPEPVAYVPVTQIQTGYLNLVVRTVQNADPLLPVITDRLAAIDSGVDIRFMKTLDQHLAEALTLDRLTTTVVVACGVATLVLATIGVYGVIGDGVRRRTPEIGLRLALGANSFQVMRLVFSEGLHLTTLGALTGVVSALVLARVVRAFVHGLPAVDTMSLAVVPVALLLVVIGAAALPTRHALRISPTIALRAE